MKALYILIIALLISIAISAETTYFNNCSFRAIDTVDGEFFWGLSMNELKAQKFVLQNGNISIVQEVNLPDTLNIDQFPEIIGISDEFYGGGFVLRADCTVVFWLSQLPDNHFRLHYKSGLKSIKKYTNNQIALFYTREDTGGGSSIILEIENGDEIEGMYSGDGTGICFGGNQNMTVIGGTRLGGYNGYGDNLPWAFLTVHRTSAYNYSYFFDNYYDITTAVFVDGDNIFAIIETNPDESGFITRSLVKKPYSGQPINICTDIVQYSNHPYLFEKIGDWIYLGQLNDLKRYNINSEIMQSVNILFDDNFIRSSTRFQDKILIALDNGLVLYQPSNSMHLINFYPHRNPIEVDNCTADTLYVYPGQIFQYNGSMNPIEENFWPGSVIGLDSITTLDVGLEIINSHWDCSLLDNEGLLYIDNLQMGWVSNGYFGIDDCGLLAMNLQNHIPEGECGHIITSVDITNNTPLGIIEESCIDNKTIISNNGVIGDIDGSGGVDQNDAIIGLGQWIDQNILQTGYNPNGQINIMRQSVLAPHPSTANIWAINGYLHNPEDSFFANLGIGSLYEVENWVPPNYINNEGLIIIDTNDNFVSIFWQNFDNSFGGQDILIANNKVMRWESEKGLEPIIFERNKNQLIQFQIPINAKLLSLSTKQINYNSSGSNDDLIDLDKVLNNAYPNPFNSQTSISFNLLKTDNVQIEVYNIRGQLVKTLFAGQKYAGNHQIIWNGTDNKGNLVTGGIYFYKLKLDSYVNTKKIVLIK